MKTPGIAGTDGCRSGWVVVRRIAYGPIEAEVVPDAATLIRSVAANHRLLVDVPIGLTEIGPREADRMARRFLGWPRMTSVFSAPIRPVLEAKSYDDASRIRRDVEHKGMSRQAWAITPKIREMDIAIRELDPGQSMVREGHPEVSFKAWAGDPMQNKKKKPAGRAERERLIAGHFGESLVSNLWPQLRGRGVAKDDFIDALAMLWSAERLRAGQEQVIPPEPDHDNYGLRMEIVY